MAEALLQEWHVVVPLALGALLVIWVLIQRLREGLGPKDLLLDRQFLTALFYTGALLAIYLSCVHYFNVIAAYRAANPSP